MRWSVLDAAFTFQALHISPFPYKTGFYNHDWDKNAHKTRRPHLLIGISDAYKYFAQHGLNETILAGLQEGGYPGVVGGFRTFARVRVVGNWLDGMNLLDT